MTRASWLAMSFPNRWVRVDHECALADSWTVEECWLRSSAADPIGRARVVNVAQGDTLNVRVGPGTGFPPIEELPPGTQVDATNIIAIADDGAAWRVIHTRRGHPGWVNDTYIELVDR